jgi:putative ABC transport system permease protein
MIEDFRFATRVLLKSPAYSLVALVTLALGIGATVAIFSAVYAVLLAPLPYPDPDALVVPVSTNAARGFDRASVPYADYLDWREQRDIFTHVAVWQPTAVDVAGSTAMPERVEAAEVGEAFFDVLGVRPMVGRTFEAADHDVKSARVAVISYGLWQRTLGGVPDVLDRDLRIGGVPVRIVGVLPPDSTWPAGQQIWLPLRPAQFGEDVRSRRDNFIFQAIARLAPGVTIAAGRTRVAAIAARVAQDHPESRKSWSSSLVAMRDYFVERELRNALLVLLTAVGVVLLIVCVNIANLLLARGTVRGHELAVRTALGASRVRLVRQLLIESLLLAAAGGALGVAVSAPLMSALRRLAPDGVPFVAAMTLNIPALAAAAALTLGSVVLFGILPAVAGSRQSPVAAMREGSAGTGTGTATVRLRDALVVAEMAMAVVLMVCAGLLIRSFTKIVNRDPGVAVDRVLAARVSLPEARYPKDDDATRFFERLTRELAAQPGIASASATSYLPAGGGGFGLGRVFLKEGQPEPPATTDYEANWNVVTPDYFRTLGIPLVRGRTFTDRDTASSPPVIVVNETFARRMFRAGDAIGHRIRSWRDENLLREIVGVVADVRYYGLGDADRALVYVPHRQNAWGVMVVAARTTGNPADFARAMREAVARIDPNLAVGRLGTLAEFARASVARERFSAALLGAFAALSILLASVGIYGVMAYVVARRSRELGLRAALGASPRALFAQVAGRGLVLTAIGGTIGLAGALAAGRLLSGLLFDTAAADPLTIGAVAVLLPAITLAACAVPARRAARVDPSATLRAE